MEFLSGNSPKIGGRRKLWKKNGHPSSNPSHHPLSHVYRMTNKVVYQLANEGIEGNQESIDID